MFKTHECVNTFKISMQTVSPLSDFDNESPWDLPLFKVENKLRSARF
jgi:hypothetical protein